MFPLFCVGIVELLDDGLLWNSLDGQVPFYIYVVFALDVSAFIPF